jgi:hypothetical protein
MHQCRHINESDQHATHQQHAQHMNAHTFFEGLIATDETRLNIFKSAVVVQDPHKTDLAGG